MGLTIQPSKEATLLAFVSEELRRRAMPKGTIAQTKPLPREPMYWPQCLIRRPR